MAISTVNVDFSAILQNAAQATGLLRVRLSQVGTVEDSETGDTVILPIAWQETTLTDGAATLALVPNKIIEPSCTYYEIQLKSVPDCPKACAKLLLSGIMYVPDEDCNVLDLLISPPSPETANTASGYASQAKQAAQVAENFAIQAGDRYDDVAEAAATALTDIGTAKQDALDAISTAQSGATEAISTAEDAALQAIGQARESALDDIGTAQGTAIGAVQAEGNTQVGRVEDAGEDAVADVTAAQGTAVSAVQAQQATSVAAVTAEGTRQTGLVTAEGTAQVNAVTQAGNGYVSTMQGLVTDAQAARDAAQTAQGLAEDAQAAAESASTDAQGYAGDASTSAGQAAQSASDAADSATAAQASAESIAASAAQIQTNERNITNIQALLNGTLYREETDSAEAYSKTVPTGAMPYASINEIGGRTVVWNQLYVPKEETITDQQGITAVYSLDGTITLNGTAVANTSFGILGGANRLRPGHTIFITGCPSGGSSKTYCILDDYQTGTPRDIGNGVVYKQTYSNGNLYCSIRIYSGTVCNNLVFKPRIIDLTLMFGAGNEPSSVAEFEAMFPSIDPAYNAGELRSAGVTEAVSEGRNILPSLQSYDAISGSGVVATPNTDGTITLNGTATAAHYLLFTLLQPITVEGVLYIHFRNPVTSSGLFFVFGKQANGNDLAPGVNSVNRIYTTPSLPSQQISNFRLYIQTGTVFNNFVFQPSVELTSSITEYVPYRSPVSLPIPAAIQALPGYGWSAGTVYNYVDYARKVYVQRVGSVDLGSLDYDVYQSSGFIFAYGKTVLSNVKIPVGNYDVANAICPKYITASYNTGIGRSTDKTIGIIFSTSTLAGKLWLCDSAYTTAADLKAALQGVMLYYELATPIETDISSLLTDNLIEVEPGGSLTFKNQNGDDFRLPVPNSETYLVQATPELPTTDGTYTLTATVTEGEVTYSWESA